MKTDISLASMRKWDLIKIIRDLEFEIDELKVELTEALKEAQERKITYTRYKVLEEEVKRLRRVKNEQ